MLGESPSKRVSFSLPCVSDCTALTAYNKDALQSVQQAETKQKMVVPLTTLRRLWLAELRT